MNRQKNAPGSKTTRIWPKTYLQNHEYGSAQRPAARGNCPERTKRRQKTARERNVWESMIHLPQRRGSVRRPGQARWRRETRRKSLRCR